MLVRPAGHPLSLGEVDILEAILVAVAGFAAAAVNAVAGGGTLITFPTLVGIGYSAKVANVTNTVGIWTGYLSGSAGYREELRLQKRRALVLFVPAIIGALVGATLLLATSESTFDWVAPFLLLFAAALMVAQSRLSDFAAHHQLGSRGGDHIPVPLHGAIFLTGIYGAYFGGGLGILNFAILTILLPDDPQRTNALKTLLSLVVNGVAAVYFALFGPVAWVPAIIIGIGALAGGYVGVGIARALGSVWLRRAVIVFAVLAALAMLAT
jgi:uncharacterized membrane protein YfcA